jgi:hypothetical protein
MEKTPDKLKYDLTLSFPLGAYQENDRLAIKYHSGMDDELVFTATIKPVLNTTINIIQGNTKWSSPPFTESRVILNEDSRLDLDPFHFTPF